MTREKLGWQRRVESAKRPLLLATLLIYLLLTVGYSVINPLFESPDEHHHFYTVLYVAENGRLPIANLQEDKLRQEAAQPPLYYILGSFLLAGEGDLDVDIWQNPHASIGDASALNNINWAIHEGRETFPWQGYALRAHLLRLFSTLLGLGTLLCIYASGRLVWPNQAEIALLATALVAFLPQFNFLHSSISNDTLVIFLCAAGLWQLLRLWLCGVTNGRLLWLGLTVGMAALSKNAGLLLLVYALGWVFLLWLRDWQIGSSGTQTDTRNVRLSDLLLLLITAVLIAGWLWVRNWINYGDMTASNMFVAFAGGDRQATILQVLGEWRSIWPSLFAVFGWFNIRPPQWIYWIWNGIVVVALFGYLKGIGDLRPAVARFTTYGREVKERFQGKLLWHEFVADVLAERWFLGLLLFGWVLAVYAGLVAFMLKTEAAQGRLLIPAILPLALGVAYGLSRFRWLAIYIVVPLLALLTSLVSLFGVIRPAYALPPIVDSLPATATSLVADMGDNVQLVGAELEADTAVPDDIIWLTLYWQANAPVAEPPQFTLDILGQDIERLGHAQGYHGRGTYPANLWPTGQIIADRFAVRLDGEGQLPVLANVFVGLVNEENRVAVGNIEVEPEMWPKTDAPALTKLGDGIELTAMMIEPTAVSPGESVTVSLQWRVTAPPTQDYTTLVHLAEEGQAPLATADNQPLNGRYPTRLWEAGEVIDDSYTFVVPDDLANGRYPLWIGMYDPETFARVPLSVDGAPQENDIFQIGWLTVSE